MHRRFRLSLVLFAAILILGAALRLFHLSSVPAELIYDEIDLYNSAESIVQTGHDVDGKLEPFLYSSYSRNPPVYAVASYASASIFGKNAFAIRLPAVIFGLICIALLCAIVLEITGKEAAALFAAFFMAVQPIFVHFSRVGWEPAAELPFLLGGLYLLLRWNGAIRTLAAATLLLGITSYAYMAGWFYAAVLGGSLLLLRAASLRMKSAWFGAGAACIGWLLVSAPALAMCFRDPLTYDRTARISTFANGVTLQTLGVFFHNYASHFSLQYLILTGDPHSGTTWRYMNGFGAFYWWLLPLAAAGIWLSETFVPDKLLRVWLAIWILAYPLGGALTNEGVPNAPRTLAGAPVFCVYAAIGAYWLYGKLRAWRPAQSRPAFVRRALPIVASIVAAVSIGHFVFFYFTRYVHQNSNAWDSGTAATFAEIRAESPNFDRVCFSIRPNWYMLDSYARFYLKGTRIQAIDDAGGSDCFLPGTLVVTDTDHVVPRSGFTPIARIVDVDGNGFAEIQGRPRHLDPVRRTKG